MLRLAMRRTKTQRMVFYEVSKNMTDEQVASKGMSL